MGWNKSVGNLTARYNGAIQELYCNMRYTYITLLIRRKSSQKRDKNKRTKFGALQSLLCARCATSIGCGLGNLKVYLAYNLSCGGEQMDRLVLYPSQAILAPTHRPGRDGRITWPGPKIRTKDLVPRAHDSRHFIQLRLRQRSMKIYKILRATTLFAFFSTDYRSSGSRAKTWVVSQLTLLLYSRIRPWFTEVKRI